MTRFKKIIHRWKFTVYHGHWCKKYYQRRKCLYKHEDNCLDNPHLIKYVKEINGLIK